MTRREFVAVGVGGVAALSGVADTPKTANLGLLLYSYGIHAKAKKDSGFAEPGQFMEFAKERGANAVQLGLGIRAGDESAVIRKKAEKLSLHVEGIVSPPKEEKADQERFASELETARACGAEVVRTVMLGGRRYEVFTKADEYPAFVQRSAEALKRAEPIARKAKVALAVENHKDFRVDELVDLLKALSSEWVGVCVDTGNNLGLLEDAVAVVESLASFAKTVHLKDIGVEEYADGFRMAEVPLGQGSLDVKGMVKTLNKVAPRARLQLEMITRDPLAIPCLTEKYWATLGKVPGRHLARMLAWVRRSARKEALPRISALKPEEQLAAEDRHVRESFEFARKSW